jgi:hypothetical protein
VIRGVGGGAYHSLEKYSKDAAHAINKLVKKRLLLCEDTEAYIEDLWAGCGVAAGLTTMRSRGRARRISK